MLLRALPGVGDLLGLRYLDEGEDGRCFAGDLCPGDRGLTGLVLCLL